MDSRWIGLHGPHIRILWMNKELTATVSISTTQGQPIRRALRRGELNEAILVQPTSRQANAAMTYGLLGSLFEYRDLGALEVNDGSRPVLAWRVVRPSVVAS